MRDVLSEFIGELLAAHASGGRVVIHHLEFDAGIINRELERAGLQCYQAVWAQIASAGVCTMDPAVGEWVRTCLGMEVAPYPNGNTMKLDFMLQGLACATSSLLSKRHTAGADAQMHVLLYRALVKLAKGSTVWCSTSNKGVTNWRGRQG